MSLELKIKSKHLSEEARIIRFEERKLKRQIKYLKERQKSQDTERSLWANINWHRRWDVRNENRATFLARAFLDGRSYKEIEQTRKPENEWKFKNKIIPRIISMANKYGNKEVTELDILNWSKLD